MKTKIKKLLLILAIGIIVLLSLSIKSGFIQIEKIVQPESIESNIEHIWDTLIENELYDSTSTSAASKNYYYHNKDKNIETYIFIRTVNDTDSDPNSPKRLINFKLDSTTVRICNEVKGTYFDLNEKEKKSFDTKVSNFLNGISNENQIKMVTMGGIGDGTIFSTTLMIIFLILMAILAFWKPIINLIFNDKDQKKKK